MSATLFVSVDPALPDQAVESIIAQIRHVAGISRVGPIAPAAKNSVMRSAYYADLAEGTDTGEILNRVSSMNGVVTAEFPPRRYAR